MGTGNFGARARVAPRSNADTVHPGGAQGAGALPDHEPSWDEPMHNVEASVKQAAAEKVLCAIHAGRLMAKEASVGAKLTDALNHPYTDAAVSGLLLANTIGGVAGAIHGTEMARGGRPMDSANPYAAVLVPGWTGYRTAKMINRAVAPYGDLATALNDSQRRRDLVKLRNAVAKAEAEASAQDIGATAKEAGALLAMTSVLQKEAFGAALIGKGLTTAAKGLTQGAQRLTTAATKGGMGGLQRAGTRMLRQGGAQAVNFARKNPLATAAGAGAVGLGVGAAT